MVRAPDRQAACPCGGAAYEHCCGPYHAGQAAPDVASLMRSRYSAYVMGLVPYLRATWAPETCPPPDESLLTPSIRWLGLDVRSHRADGETATVEFVARYKINGRAGRLHEISQFRQDASRWVYVSGTFPTSDD